MGDFLNPTLFVYKKNRGGFLMFLTWQASSKTVKIHPSGDRAACYRQRGWYFICLQLMNLNKTWSYQLVLVVLPVLLVVEWDRRGEIIEEVGGER